MLTKEWEPLKLYVIEICWCNIVPYFLRKFYALSLSGLSINGLIVENTSLCSSMEGAA